MEPLELLYVIFYLIFGAWVGLRLKSYLLFESLKLRKWHDFGACCVWIVVVAIVWFPGAIGLIGLVTIASFSLEEV